MQQQLDPDFQRHLLSGGQCQVTPKTRKGHPAFIAQENQYHATKEKTCMPLRQYLVN
jgi:hypothetical protein